MKTLALLLLIIIPLQWETDFENAKKTAREEHRLILLNFSGSDWCTPCILTKKEYFDNEAFIKMAGDNLVLLTADFPRKKKNQLSAEQVRKNEALAEKYNKEGNFPYTLLLDADGKVLKTWKGKPATPPEEWAQEIGDICKSHK